MQPDHSAPINLQWGYDNRSCGLRVPISGAQSMRVENRLPGADSNPYLAIASSLVAGYLGLMGRIVPMPMLDTNAYLHERTLPRSLDVALDRMASCGAVTEILGREFIESFLRIKVKELSAFQGVSSSWERDHLLLKV
jgi:glutamine synthetase